MTAINRLFSVSRQSSVISGMRENDNDLDTDEEYLLAEIVNTGLKLKYSSEVTTIKQYKQAKKGGRDTEGTGAVPELRNSVRQFLPVQ